MSLKKYVLLLSLLLSVFLVGWSFVKGFPSSIPGTYSVGDKVDSLNGVYVYYNGAVSNVSGRNTASDGYNLGLNYQCVEFVKRYYYEYFKHKMPNSYGHAKDFYDVKLKDGQLNKQRNLVQYSNPSKLKPKVNDLIIFDGTRFNKYGHVAIVSKVTDKGIEIIQQNPGPMASSRARYTLSNNDETWKVSGGNVLGWLRMR